MNSIFIVTEANASVATGHLLECIDCMEELKEIGYEISFWINDDMECSLKRRINGPYQQYRCSIEMDYTLFLSEIERKRPVAILFNLREISENFLEKMRSMLSTETKLICIDEFGHRCLQADIIINPMIDSYYWDYGESHAILFCGAEYLVLSKKLGLLHKKDKKIKRNIDRFVITMGGVDPQNYTLDLMEAVVESFSGSEIDVIVGGGNQNLENIMKKAAKYQNITVRENIPNLPDLMYEADLVICAGGNTLHEAACIGTPAIVLPSMPHEERTAKCFEKKGFGVVVDVSTDWKKDFFAMVDVIKPMKVREEMSISGKLLSDGLGRKRIVEIIQKIGE